jgi:hypothetical protein
MNAPTVHELVSELVAIHANVEWGDYDGEDFSVDVRLQCVDGAWYVHTGDPQYDMDHRGCWGVGTIGEDDGPAELAELAESMIDELED